MKLGGWRRWEWRRTHRRWGVIGPGWGVWHVCRSSSPDISKLPRNGHIWFWSWKILNPPTCHIPRSSRPSNAFKFPKSRPTFIPRVPYASLPQSIPWLKNGLWSQKSIFIVMASNKILTSSFRLWHVLLVFNDSGNVSRIVMMRWRNGKRSCLLWRTAGGESFRDFQLELI